MLMELLEWFWGKQTTTCCPPVALWSTSVLVVLPVLAVPLPPVQVWEILLALHVLLPASVGAWTAALLAWEQGSQEQKPS